MHAIQVIHTLYSAIAAVAAMENVQAALVTAIGAHDSISPIPETLQALAELIFVRIPMVCDFVNLY